MLGNRPGLGTENGRLMVLDHLHGELLTPSLARSIMQVLVGKLGAKMSKLHTCSFCGQLFSSLFQITI